MAFAPDGKRFLAGTGSFKGSKKNGNAVELWDVESGKALQHLEGHNRQVLSVAFAPDGKRTLSGSFDGQLRYWDLERRQTDPRHRHQGAGHPRSSFCRTASRPAASADSSVRLWDLENGKELKKLDGHSGGINCLALSGKGELLSGSTDGSARLWDIATGKELHKFEGHTGAVHGVAFLPQPGRILTGSNDMTVPHLGHRQRPRTGPSGGQHRSVLGVAVCTTAVMRRPWARMARPHLGPAAATWGGGGVGD